MRKLAIFTVAAGIVGLLGAAPAFASAGQCYDAYGRPVGPVYDTDHPNYGYIDSILARGGSCTGVVTPPSNSYNYGPRYYHYAPRYQNHHNYHRSNKSPQQRRQERRERQQYDRDHPYPNRTMPNR
jgi:hypothetical protein